MPVPLNDAPLSVLLLAWDDADPAPAALGAPLLPGTPLRHVLAAHLRLTAILPQQPAQTPADVPAAAAPSETGLLAEAAVPAMPAPGPAETTETANAAGSSAPAVAVPAIVSAAPEGRLAAPDASPLAAVVSAPVAPKAAFLAPEPGAPVLLGLADFTLAELRAEAGRRGSPAVAGTWPAGGWRAPAAPYAGSSAAGHEEQEQVSAPPPAAAAAPAAARPSGGRATPLPADLLPGAAALAASAFEAAEPGPAEAASLTQAPNAPPAAPPPEESALPAALTALRRPAAPEKPVSAAGEEATATLPFRAIQYARFATQLTAGGAGFAIIFAAAWPTWLAAVEIRQRTGRPLVLYVPELPSARAPRAARGWLLELERQALRRAEVVLVPTAALAGFLSERYSLARPPVVLSGVSALSEPPPNLPIALKNQLLTNELLAQLRAAARPQP